MKQKIIDLFNKYTEIISNNSNEIKGLAYLEFILVFSMLGIGHYLNGQFKYQVDKLEHIQYSFAITLILYFVFFMFFRPHFIYLDGKTKIDSKKLVIMISILGIGVIKEFADILLDRNPEFMDLMFNYVGVAFGFIVIDVLIKFFKKNGNKIVKMSESIKKENR